MLLRLFLHFNRQNKQVHQDHALLNSQGELVVFISVFAKPVLETQWTVLYEVLLQYYSPTLAQPMNPLANIVASRVQTIQQYLYFIKRKTPEDIPSHLSFDQQYQLLLCALFKIATKFLQLAYFCLSHLEFPSQQKLYLETIISNNMALIAKLYAQISSNMVPRKKQASQETKIKNLRQKFAELSIRIPKAPVSAFYLFFLYSKRKSKNQPKRNFSTQWSNMQSIQKQPYQLLAAEIHRNYNNQSKSHACDPEKQTNSELAKRRPENKTERIADKSFQLQSKLPSLAKTSAKQSLSEESNEDILSDSQAQLILSQSLQPFQEELKSRSKENESRDLGNKQRETQFNCPEVKN